MIVKNEEKFIRQCLESALEIADEAFVVDTGSTDGTLEILKNSFDNRIHLIEADWEENFSKARNLSIEQASGDWILVLDGDEIITGDKLKLVDTLRKGSASSYFITIYNKLKDNEYYESAVMPRLFLNDKPEYRGRIHEQIFLNGQRYEAEHLPKSICTIEHFGYLEDIFEEKSKGQRNLTIIKKELEDNPEDGFSWYNLGVTYMSQKNYTKAVDAFIQANNFTDDKSKIYMEDLALRLGRCLYEARLFSELEGYLEELGKNEKIQSYAPFLMLQGELALTKNQLDEAARCFQKAYDQAKKYDDNSGFELASYKANLEIARIYVRQKKTDEAILKYCEVVFDGANKSLEGKLELFKFLKKNKKQDVLNHVKMRLKEQEERREKTEKMKIPSVSDIQQSIESGDLDQAKEMLEQYEDVFGNDFYNHSLSMIIAMIERKFDLAEREFNAAMRIDNQDYDLLYNGAYLYKILGDKAKFDKYRKEAVSRADTEEKRKGLEELT